MSMSKKNSLKLKMPFTQALWVLGISTSMVFSPLSTQVARGENSANPANVFVGLAKKVVPSVVNISTVSIQKGRPGVPGRPAQTPEDLFREFFGGPSGIPKGRPRGGPMEVPRKSMSLGSGFIIDPSGLILTNHHVVDRATEIKIYFTEDPKEKPTDGEVVGKDPELDLALIRVNTSRMLVALPLGDSAKLEQGEYVMAVGNPVGQGHSVSHGIISAKERAIPEFTFSRYLQTDAPINPGNSGGPLVNLKGEVIGINNAIHAGAQGIGFAIPVNAVKEVLPQLRSKGSVTRGYIGVGISELNEDLAAKLGLSKNAKGAMVNQVYPGDPADKAGVEPYDVITEFDGKSVASGEDLVRAVTSTPVDKKASLKVMRAGKEKTLSITLSKRPTEEPMGLVAPKDDDILELVGVKLKETPKGLEVTGLEFDSPADEAGLMRGDIIVEINRKKVSKIKDFYSAVKKGESFLLRVLRQDPGGKEIFAVVLLDLKT